MWVAYICIALAALGKMTMAYPGHVLGDAAVRSSLIKTSVLFFL
jgi:hypothetical protein